MSPLVNSLRHSRGTTKERVSPPTDSYSEWTWDPRGWFPRSPLRGILHALESLSRWTTPRHLYDQGIHHRSTISSETEVTCTDDYDLLDLFRHDSKEYGTMSNGGNRPRTAGAAIEISNLCVPGAKPPPLQGILLDPILYRLRELDSTHEVLAGQHDWIPVPIGTPHAFPRDR